VYDTGKLVSCQIYWRKREWLSVKFIGFIELIGLRRKDKGQRLKELKSLKAGRPGSQKDRRRETEKWRSGERDI
jgi:hypothetical protein